MNQYKIDVLRFSDLLSKYTGISKTKIDEFINNNTVNNIFDHPTALNISPSQLTKIYELKELLGLYKNLKQDYSAQYKLNSPASAGDYFISYFNNHKDKERFVCAFLDNSNNVISTKIMNTGTVGQAPVFPREIVKESLFYDTAGLLIAHNHPSGTLKPSPQDIDVTSRIAKALKTVDIKLNDSIIVGNGGYFSFLEQGLLCDMYKSDISPRIAENIRNQYMASYPAVQFISANTALAIDQLNKSAGKVLTIKDIQNLYESSGKNCEASGSAQDLQKFNNLKEIIEDIRHANIIYKESEMSGRKSPTLELAK